MTLNHQDVAAFHEKFGLPQGPEWGGRKLDDLTLAFRIEFMREELDEFIQAAVRGDEPEMFDALIDLVYVALGTAQLAGYPWQAGWQLVQEANMAKVRAQADGSDSKRGSALDIVKPEGWTAPDIAGCLRRFGWAI